MPIIAIAPAANELTIPLNSFATMEDAIKFYKDLGFTVKPAVIFKCTKCGYKGIYNPATPKYFPLACTRWIKDKHCQAPITKEISTEIYYVDVDDFLNHHNDRKFNKVQTKILEKLFLDGNYYGGCGECTEIILQHYDFGVPFAAFNLD